jgi:hypothetical protein
LCEIILAQDFHLHERGVVGDRWGGTPHPASTNERARKSAQPSPARGEGRVVLTLCALCVFVRDYIGAAFRPGMAARWRHPAGAPSTCFAWSRCCSATPTAPPCRGGAISNHGDSALNYQKRPHIGHEAVELVMM